MRHYLGVAKKKGVTNEEIGAVEAVVMAVQAGRVKAQLAQVTGRSKGTEDSPGLSPG